MFKATVTRLFLGGSLAAIAGAVLAVAAVWTAIANDIFVMNGPDIVGLRGGALAWSLTGLGVVAAVAMLAGAIAGLVSWIGALLNTSQLDSKAWFIALLLLGIFSFGLVGMIAYVIAGPDGAAGGSARTTSIPAGATSA